MSFLCIFCHQAFPKEVNLKLHLRVHEKEVGCELCGKSVHNTKFSLHVNDCKRWPKIKKKNIKERKSVEEKKKSPKRPSTSSGVSSTNVGIKELVVMLTRLDAQVLKKYGIGSENVMESSKKIQCRLIQCLGCSNQYASKMTMQRHYKIIHLNEKFQCDKCNKSFTDSRYLRDHKRSQHLGLFYRCEPCGKEFNIELTYNKHVKNCALK